MRWHFSRRPLDLSQGLAHAYVVLRYHEKMQVDHTHIVMELTQLSDAALAERLQDTLAKLGIQANAGDVIDLKALPNGEDGAGS